MLWTAKIIMVSGVFQYTIDYHHIYHNYGECIDKVVMEANKLLDEGKSIRTLDCVKADEELI